MRQKKTWMYLLIGISSLSCLINCTEGDVDYRITVEIMYLNSTDSLIEFDIKPDLSFNEYEIILLAAKSTSRIYSYDIDGADKKPRPETCCDGVFSSLFRSDNFNRIIVNDKNCLVHDNMQSAKRDGYQLDVISDRTFRYTYTFTEDDLIGGVPCE